jgi:antitoxin CcdA
MKTIIHTTTAKRPVNLLLNEETVRQARHFTDNLSATVDGLLATYVAQQDATRLSRRQLGDTVAEVWNRFHAEHGGFADEYSTL